MAWVTSILFIRTLIPGNLVALILYAQQVELIARPIMPEIRRGATGAGDADADTVQARAGDLGVKCVANLAPERNWCNASTCHSSERRIFVSAVTYGCQMALGAGVRLSFLPRRAGGWVSLNAPL